jgi:hypothetical protein
MPVCRANGRRLIRQTFSGKSFSRFGAENGRASFAVREKALAPDFLIISI